MTYRLSSSSPKEKDVRPATSATSCLWEDRRGMTCKQLWANNKTCFIPLHEKGLIKQSEAMTTYSILLSIFPMGLYFRFCCALSWMKSDTSFSIWARRRGSVLRVHAIIHVIQSSRQLHTVKLELLVRRELSPSSWTPPSFFSRLPPSSWASLLALKKKKKEKKKRRTEVCLFPRQRLKVSVVNTDHARTQLALVYFYKDLSHKKKG